MVAKVEEEEEEHRRWSFVVSSSRAERLQRSVLDLSNEGGRSLSNMGAKSLPGSPYIPYQSSRSRVSLLSEG